MLRHLGFRYFAENLETGIYKTLLEGKAKTPDIDGTSTSKEFTAEIINNLKL